MKEIDFGNKINTSLVTEMDYMFDKDSNLTALDLSASESIRGMLRMIIATVCLMITSFMTSLKGEVKGEEYEKSKT